MKASFIRLDMRVIKAVILSVLMVLLFGGQSHAVNVGDNCSTDVGGPGAGACDCDGAMVLYCFPNTTKWIDAPVFCSSQVCVSTTQVTDIKTTEASSDGDVNGNNITAKGVCWDISTNPTANCTNEGAEAGTFKSSITGLSSGITYYVRAYATATVNATTTTTYGDEINFTTLASATAPTVTTAAVSTFDDTTATLGGNITATGGEKATTRGVCWSTSTGPTTADSTSEDTGSYGIEPFSFNVTGLTAGETYYVKAYAENSVDISYGAEVNFTTLNVPTVTTSEPDSMFISQTGATIFGNVTSDGGATVTVRGFCYGGSADPTGNCTTNGSGTGSFNSGTTIAGLTAATTYHVRAYADNSVGRGYGEDRTFATDPPDTPHIEMDPTTVTVNEGGTATFGVTLSAAPTGNVTVAVTWNAGDSDISVQYGASLSFTTSDYDTPQTVTLEAVEDADTSNGTATIQLVATGGLSDTRTVEATESDNDILMTDTASVTVSEGGTGTFNVKLSAQPASSVAVTVARSAGDTDISVKTGGSLTFTTSNWGTDQAVTLEAAEDDDSGNGTATIQVSATGLTPVDVTATEQDNDILFVTDPASAVVPEGGTASFNVKLSAQPASNVTVTVEKTAGDTDISVNTGGTLAFTTSNWDTNQEVTLAAAEDVDSDSGTATIQVSATGLTTVDVTAREQDNDILFVTDPASPDVPEDGTVSFNVKLSAQPGSDVTVTVSVVSGGDPSITVQSGASLTFTTANWNSNQSVTLAAADDDDIVNGTATIRLSAAGLDPKDVAATEQDDDELALVINPTSVTVTEGITATFDVNLLAQPASTVTVSVTRTSGDTDITVEPASLEFTTLTWGTIQKVTVSAAEDVDTTNGTATIQVAATGGLTESKDVEATESDNDVLALVIDPTSVTVSEGGEAAFNVKLSMVPGSNVTVTSTMVLGEDGSISLKSGGSLTFTTTDWDTDQAVTLEAAEDDDASNGTATVNVVASGGLDESKEVTATEDDKDILEIVTTATSAVTVTENSTATFDVSLSAQPDSEVTVSVTRATGGDTDISVQPATLTFTTSTWNTDQKVTLIAADDADMTSDTATIRLSADGLDPVDVNATEQDDDELIIIATPTSVIVPEEGTATFKVKLSLEPSNTVTVSVAHKSGDTDITVKSGASLIFTTSDWESDQEVTLAAGKDDDITNGDAIIQLSSDGLASVDVTATEQDDGIIKGNIDCNGDVDLADLILALKISAGIATTDETVCNADVNNDGKIGVEELIYILQEVLTPGT